jgi:molybdopterin-binding protein
MKISARNSIKDRIITVESEKVISNAKLEITINYHITTATPLMMLKTICNLIKKL